MQKQRNARAYTKPKHNAREKRCLQDKAEATGRLRVLIQSHDDLLDLSGPREELVDLLLCCVERHVPNINSCGCLQRVLILLLIAWEPSVPVC